METYRINAYLIGDSPRDGKNQILSEKLFYCSTNTLVKKQNCKRLSKTKNLLLTNGVDYNNIRLIVQYNDGVKKIKKYSQNEWLNNIDYRYFLWTKEEKIIREKIIDKKIEKIVREIIR